MTIIPALHLTLENSDHPDIRLSNNGMIRISIPPSDSQRRWQKTTRNINGLRMVLSQLPKNWKIEGILTVSLLEA